MTFITTDARHPDLLIDEALRGDDIVPHMVNHDATVDCRDRRNTDGLLKAISRESRNPKAEDQDLDYDRRSPGRWRDRSSDRGGYYDGYRSSSPRRDRSYYDRDRPDDDIERRPRSRDDSGTPNRDRSSSRGKPSKEIMMDNLPPHLTENDVR